MTDKLKPVNCGCGGKSAVLFGVDKGHEYYIVKCWGCGTQTVKKRHKAEAITAWNRAMGSAEKSSVVERTAKVDTGHKSVITGKLMDGHCMQCGRYVMDEDDYCPGCGARLEWE